MSPAGAIRWYIRLETVRPTRFGEPAREGMLWAVMAYTTRDRNGDPIPMRRPTYLASLPAAVAFARRQMRMTYRQTKGTR